MTTKSITVVDEFGDPLKNAHVQLTGPFAGTTTNSNGVASITGYPENTVSISYVGTEKQFFKLKELPSKVTMRMETLPTVTVEAPKKKEKPNRSYLVPTILGLFGLMAVMSFGNSEEKPVKAKL